MKSHGNFKNLYLLFTRLMATKLGRVLCWLWGRGSACKYFSLYWLLYCRLVYMFFISKIELLEDENQLPAYIIDVQLLLQHMSSVSFSIFWLSSCILKKDYQSTLQLFACLVVYLTEILVWKSFKQNFNRIVFAQTQTYLDCHRKLINFLIITQIISPTQLWLVGGGGKLWFLVFWGQSFDVQGFIL